MPILPVVACVVHNVGQNIYRYYIFGEILSVEVSLDLGILLNINIPSIILNTENQVAWKFIKSLNGWGMGGPTSYFVTSN